MSVKTSICNMSLSHLGSGKEIGNVDVERSNEAAACRLFFLEALKTVLRAWSWPFATKISALALIAEDPNDEWKYSYRYPSDCLLHRRILSGIRNDSIESRIPSKISNDSIGQIILTDQALAYSEYTILVENYNLFPSDFRMALSYQLASMICPRVAGGNQSNLSTKMLQLAEIWISRAQTTGANEEQRDVEQDSPMILARDGGLRWPYRR